MSNPKQPVYAIGIMSGTSMDGVDAVVIEIGDNEEMRICSIANRAFTADLKKKLRKLIRRKIAHAGESGDLDMELADIYGNVARELIDGFGGGKIAVVGCHGQTVHHSPDSDPPFTVQIGNGPEIARICGTPVVTDFRSADIAMGGQGAPLAPAFHQAAFSSPGENRCVINIGGISNITFLPSDPDDEVTGFDTGPGNTLMDYWCRSRFDCDFDLDGKIAESGAIQIDLLDILLGEPYLALPPPKSTGVELFNEEWLIENMEQWDGRFQSSDTDVLTTLTAFTARTIADQINASPLAPGTAYLCGGGAKNPLLLAMIAQQTSTGVETTGALGIDPQWVEPAAFGWMAHRTLNGLKSTLPSVTGASEATIAGKVHYP